MGPGRSSCAGNGPWARPCGCKETWPQSHRCRGRQRLTEVYHSWANTAERELCSILGVRVARPTRGFSPRLAWRSVLPAHSCPLMGKTATSWKCLQDRLRQLVWVLRKLGQHPVAARAQCRELAKWMLKPPAGNEVFVAVWGALSCIGHADGGDVGSQPHQG